MFFFLYIQFKIGCARYDEIISDTAISREHRCKGDNKWKLEETQGNKDLNDSITLISDTAVFPKVMQNVSSGDIIQFSPNEKFKYTFTLVEREHCVKKACIEKAVYHILVKQKAFAASQECERKEVKDTIQVKQKEEDALRQVSDLLQQSVAKNDEEDLLKKIAMLEGKVQTSIDERLQYEKSMNEEKQKWQKTLHMRKRQIKMFKRKMQKLRKLQVQEKKMRRKIKILETRFKELEKGLSDNKIIKEISEKCTTKLLTWFNGMFFNKFYISYFMYIVLFFSCIFYGENFETVFYYKLLRISLIFFIFIHYINSKLNYFTYNMCIYL